MYKKSKRTIVVTKNIAFCSGVKRAVSLAESEAKANGNIFTVDAILHNEEEVKRLESIGIKKISDGDIGEVAILPAHGSTVEEITSLSKRFEKVIDTTCPLVLRTVKIIERVKQEDYKIAIVGDERHRETMVLKDKAGDSLYGVFQDTSFIESYPFIAKLAVVAQSTSTEDSLLSVAKLLLNKTYELRFFNTICEETLMRQQEAKKIAKSVDCMIVIGGKSSANSQRLFEIVMEINPNTHFLHSIDDLKSIDISQCDSIGLTSGTSTPSWLINEVIKIISLL